MSLAVLMPLTFRLNATVLTSGEHAGSADSPVEYPDPDSAAFVDVAGLRLPTLEALVEFKIASGIWGNRPQDLADVQRLIRLNGLTEAFADRVARPLRERFLDLVRESVSSATTSRVLTLGPTPPAWPPSRIPGRKRSDEMARVRTTAPSEDRRYNRER